jgi:Zn-dependent protease with chaperone function
MTATRTKTSLSPGTIASSRPSPLSEYGSWAAALLPALLAACATPNAVDYATGGASFNRFALRDEVSLGTRLSTLFLASAEALGQPIDADTAETQRLARIFARLLAVPENRARMPPFPWELHVITSNGAEAWCFPGGQVLTLSGLGDLARLPSDDALAALVAHELAHAAARHGTELRTLERYLEALPFAAFFGDRLVALDHATSPDELRKRFSQRELNYSMFQEHEADLIGLELMARAGYDPTRAVTGWAAVLDPEARSSSHPPAAERLRMVEAHVDAARYVAARMRRLRPDADADLTLDRPLDARAPTAGSDARAAAARAPVVVRAPTALLDAELTIGGPAAAPSYALKLRAGQDLVEDRLAIDAELVIDRLVGVLDDAQVARVRVTELGLLDRRPLEGPRLALRGTLPRLRPGRYLARARALVGAIEVVRERRFDVAVPGARISSLSATRGESMPDLAARWPKLAVAPASRRRG